MIWSKRTPAWSKSERMAAKALSGAIVNAGRIDLRHDLGTVDPRDAVVRGNDELFADPVDLDLFLPLADAHRFDRQQLAFAGPLPNVGGGGQIVPVEVMDQLPARLDEGGIGDEHGLVNDRAARSFLVDDGFDGPQGVFPCSSSVLPLCGTAAAKTWRTSLSSTTE